MKAKLIQYAIQNPCDENWNEMTPESNGRFCDSCQKSVVDFTLMSDFSIVNYLESHKHEKVCGRFTKPQLERVYSLNQPVFTPAFDLRAVVLGLALTTFCAVHSFGQTEPQEPVKTDTTLHTKPLFLGQITYRHYIHEKEKIASGTVHNSANNYTYVTVRLKNADGTILKTLQPDSKGRFKFDLYWSLNPASIDISGIGYESQEFYFSSLRTLSNIQVHLLDEVEMIRGEVIQGDVKATDGPEEDQILQKIEMGNVCIEKK